MTLDPSRRTHLDPPKKSSTRDVDLAGRARSLKALGWALYAGLPIGGAAGFAAGHPLLGFLLGPIIIWTVSVAMGGIAARGAGLFFLPSESSIPRKREYSRAKALAVRGEYEAAIVAYQTEILEIPGDVEPYLAIARMYRDDLKQPDEALVWFRRGIAEAESSEGQELLTRREIAELFIHHLQEPTRAAPDLARMAEMFPGTSAGSWAEEELARIKKEMRG